MMAAGYSGASPVRAAAANAGFDQLAEIAMTSEY